VALLNGNSPVTHINDKQCRAVINALNMSIKKMAMIELIRFAATQEIK
jgi:hypothetical protein